MNEQSEVNVLRGDSMLDELLMERFALAKKRIAEICTEQEIKEPFGDFFRRAAELLKKTGEILERKENNLSLQELKEEECSSL